MRLPYGAQHDEAHAVAALEFVAPGQVLVTNIKARQRMVAQYAAAGRLGALVVGTDHAAEAVMGFYADRRPGGRPAPAAGRDRVRRDRAQRALPVTP
jgi:NAD+ synthase